MLKSLFLENLALDWMINKPLTPAKENCNKPITDKYLTTRYSRRQNLDSTRKIFLSHSVAKQTYERESSDMSSQNGGKT